MKRYLLFAGHAYYPWGGFDDLVFQSDSIEECKDYFALNTREIALRGGGYIHNWAHIVDANTMMIICNGRLSDDGGGVATWEHNETRD